MKSGLTTIVVSGNYDEILEARIQAEDFFKGISYVSGPGISSVKYFTFCVFNNFTATNDDLHEAAKESFISWLESKKRSDNSLVYKFSVVTH